MNKKQALQLYMEQLAAQVEAHPNLEFDEVKAELISLPTLGERISAVEKILELDEIQPNDHNNP